MPTHLGRTAPARLGLPTALVAALAAVLVTLAFLAALVGPLPSAVRGAEDVPRLSGPITDLTDTLSSSEEAQAQEAIVDLRSSQAIDLWVLFTDTTNPLSVTEYARRSPTGTRWVPTTCCSSSRWTTGRTRSGSATGSTTSPTTRSTRSSATRSSRNSPTATSSVRSRRPRAASRRRPAGRPNTDDPDGDGPTGRHAQPTPTPTGTDAGGTPTGDTVAASARSCGSSSRDRPVADLRLVAAPSRRPPDGRGARQADRPARHRGEPAPHRDRRRAARRAQRARVRRGAVHAGRGRAVPDRDRPAAAELAAAFTIASNSTIRSPRTSRPKSGCSARSSAAVAARRR